MRRIYGALGYLLVAAAVACLLASKAAQADPILPDRIYVQGHCDLDVHYEEDEQKLHLHYHFHADEPGRALDGSPLLGGYHADGLLVFVPDLVKQSAPANIAASLGVTPGTPVWILPQSDPGGGLPIPFLGFGTHHLDHDDWQSDITHRLLQVVGPGHFAMWQEAPGGGITVFWTSADGIGAAEDYTIPPLGHEHANWGFTQPGLYQITWEAFGTLSGGSQVSSGPETFLFLVGDQALNEYLQGVPEPSTWLLLALGSLGLGGSLWRRQRR